MSVETQIRERFKEAYGAAPEQLAFAPGRIEFIGNHTDYNGGLVMGVAVAEGITVALRRRSDEVITLMSDAGDPVQVRLDALRPVKGAASWSNYPVGVAKVMREAGMRLDQGFEMMVHSTLPAGAGLSSSAAFELATAYGLAGLYGFESDPAGFARIGRKAENDFVGMPCGILDQGVSAFGRADHIVRIDCAEEAFSLVAMPKGARFWIFNSNKKHALVDSAYADRHRECGEAFERLKKRFGDRPNLSAVSMEELKGAKDLLDDVRYRRALHVVGENERVRKVERALAEDDLGAVGALLLESHESSRVNFENSTPELDFLVDQLAQQVHVYGARLTGGGFGGAVMALTDDQFGPEHATVIEAVYREKFGLSASVFHTTAGDGARRL